MYLIRRSLAILCVLSLTGHLPARDAAGTDSVAALRKDAQWCASMLQELGIAKANYMATYDNRPLPSAWGPRGGLPGPALYSWRVALLPFMEQEPLFKGLWENSANWNIPPVPPKKGADPRSAVLKKFLGEHVPVYSLEKWNGKPGKTIFRRVTTGKPEQFIVIESADLVDWAVPGDEFALTEGKPLPRIAGNFPGGFFALCGDGKVRFLPSTLDAKVLRAALVEGKGVPALPRGGALKKAIEKLDLTGKK